MNDDPPILTWLATETGRRALWWALGLLFGLTLLAFVAVGANKPKDPSLKDAEQAALRVTAADGTVKVHCVLVADEPDERARGLMERADLGGKAGMAFVFPADTDSAFYMANTPMPLTVVWYAADGSYVSAADMDPCLQGPPDACPRHRPAGRYRLAVEVPKGQAPAAGLVPGSKAAMAGRCA